MKRFGKRQNQRSNKIVALLGGLALICSCNSSVTNDEEPLARVHESYLYPSEVQSIFPENISADDSAKMTKSYVNNWIRKQLLVHQAEQVMDDDFKNIERQVEDYRNSLIIFKYQQKLIQQKLDTMVTDSEIVAYYDEYRSNFILPYNIVKALYIKLPKGTPDIERVKDFYKSDTPEDISRLEDYCYQYAVKYDHFDNKWVGFKQVISQIPTQIDDPKRFIRFRKYLETEDSLFYYFLRIKEFHLQGEEQPIDYAHSRIKSIILNKRKFSFIEELENGIYNDALNRNDFVIY